MNDTQKAAVSTSVDGFVTRQATVRSIRAELREVDFIFSTDSIDTYGERVKQNWRLERYLQNPVVLFSHCSRELPIGKAKNVGVVDGALQGTLVFASEKANPLAEQVWQSIQEGTLRAGSVGFMSHSFQYEKDNDIETLVLDDNELLEFSVCPIGANPDALAKMKAKALADYRAKHPTPTPPAEATKPTASAEKDTKKMDPEKIIAERDKSIADLNAKAVESSEKLKAANLEIEAQKAQNAHLATERDAAVKRASDAEALVIEHEVEGLVGVKIAPAEKPVFVELRKANKSLFDAMIAQRSEMSLTKSVITEPTADVATPPPAVENDPQGQKLFAEFSKA